MTLLPEHDADASMSIEHLIQLAPALGPVRLPPWYDAQPGPVLDRLPVNPTDADLTVQHDGPPIGERIILHGRVLDEVGQPVPGTLVEIWQVNSAGRYRDDIDVHDAPLDPNFSGFGRTRTDGDGRWRFVTIKPPPYPAPPEGWRSAHIHFSLVGPRISNRLVTQMYFPADPVHERDEVFLRMTSAQQTAAVASFDWDASVPYWALAYSWDIVLGATAPHHDDDDDHDKLSSVATPEQTAGPMVRLGLSFPDSNCAVDPSDPGAVEIIGRVLSATDEPVLSMLEFWQDDQFARCIAIDGAFRCTVRKPVPRGGPDGSVQAPHFNVSLYVGGFLPGHHVTRMYFPDESLANERDPVLASIPKSRRGTLVATPGPEGELQFDLRLRGDDEQVFFELSSSDSLGKEERPPREPLG